MSAPTKPRYLMSHEEHAVWWDGLSEDERMLACVPVGYWFQLLVISYVKHALVKYEMAAGDRLFFLERLDKLADGYLTLEMIQTIAPMSDTEVAMMREAKTLDRKGDPAASASVKVLTSWDVFNQFLRLNPSLLAAMRLREAERATR